MQDNDVARDAVDRARRFVQSGDDIAAHEVLNVAIQKGCSAPILKKKRAQVYWFLGAWEPALYDIVEYLKANPGDGEAWFNKGYVLSKLRRSAEGLACCEESQRLGYSPKEVRDVMVCLRATLAESQGILENMKTEEPGKRNKDYWWRRVLLEVDVGDLAGALESAQAWSDSMPNDVWSKWGFGYVLQVKGAWKDARSVFEEIRDRGYLDDANRALATSASLRGDWAEVAQLAARVLEKFPDDQRMLRLRALAYLTEGSYESFRRLSVTEPPSSNASRK